jgi:hypothetical protein
MEHMHLPLFLRIVLAFLMAISFDFAAFVNALEHDTERAYAKNFARAQHLRSAGDICEFDIAAALLTTALATLSI